MCSMRKFHEGYRKFRERYVKRDSTLLRSLHEEGQNPSALMIACSDSRVDPAIVLQADPGDIFMVRNVANLVPPYGPDHKHHGTSSALEYGVRYLHIPNIIVCGHSSCGGITAHITKELPQDDFISEWLAIVPHYASDTPINVGAKKSLIYSGENLLTYPWIKERVVKGELAIHLWFFNIPKGEIEAYNEQTNTFNPL